MTKTGLDRIPYCKAFFLVAAMLCFFCLGCGVSRHPPVEFRYQQEKAIQNLQAKNFSYPQARFVVLSDPHYYHPSLGTSGPAFEAYIRDDRKMLAKSDEILDAATKRVRREKADFILICGDLTKDGEKTNHRHVAEKIGNLHPSAEIYVVPGNHDVANGVSRRYTKTGTEPVATVCPEKFKKIYRDYGYGSPLDADAASLSYVVEPVPGLWVLALDSCLWRENKPGRHPVTDGRFSGQTLKWIEDVLIRSKQQEKAVLAFMHHGLMEHYPANEKYYGQYVIDNSDALTRLFAAYGVHLVFTGHFHAQDITAKNPEQPTARIFDVETGSLVTYPCPYRTVEFSKDGTCTIESRFIRSIDSMDTGFTEYARNFAFRGTVGIADKALEGYWVSEKGRDILAPQIAEAYVAHLKGDEKPPEEVLTTRGTRVMGRIVVFSQKDLVQGWWTDLWPADNSLIINFEDDANPAALPEHRTARP
ncbi:MAG: metallophosphoesterase [Desulfobacteraceae bacterium]|nr:metallophosphoesterase [Desulfobacteraceae bacterium]